jgi:large subunit ribosomal protein L35
MSSCHKAAKPLSRCLQQAQGLYNSNAAVRSFSTNSARCNEAVAEAAAVKLPNPLIATSKKSEKILMEHGVLPVGSRRRRAALQTSGNIPFEQLPYQCFQEARKILQADRAEKLKEIEVERERINRLVARDASEVPGGEVEKQNRLLGMRKYLEKLKILADINDPLIKKRFEDGEGMLDYFWIYN